MSETPMYEYKARYHPPAAELFRAQDATPPNQIRVSLSPDPSDVLERGQPAHICRAWVLGLVHLPRFQPNFEDWVWDARHVSNFLIDPGSDTTMIGLSDALDLVPPELFENPTGEIVIAGIGGATTSLLIEPANLHLFQGDGNVVSVPLDISIEKPTDRELGTGETAPAIHWEGVGLLGRDVLFSEGMRFEMGNEEGMPYARMWKST